MKSKNDLLNSLSYTVHSFVTVIQNQVQSLIKSLQSPLKNIKFILVTIRKTRKHYPRMMKKILTTKCLPSAVIIPTVSEKRLRKPPYMRNQY